LYNVKGEKMKKSAVWILAAAGFALVMGGAVWAYGRLAPEYEEKQEMIVREETHEHSGKKADDETVSAGSSGSETAAGESAGIESSGSETAVGESSGSEGDRHEDDAIMAVDFTMLNMDGESVSLSDYYGKPVVLNFWASWCGPCQMEMPHFDEAYREYADRVNFVIVNLTDGDRETVEGAKQFIEDAGYEFPICFDTEGKGMYAYGVMSIPMTFFINEESEVTGYRVGSLTRDVLFAQIEGLLE